MVWDKLDLIVTYISLHWYASLTFNEFLMSLFDCFLWFCHLVRFFSEGPDKGKSCRVYHGTDTTYKVPNMHSCSVLSATQQCNKGLCSADCVNGRRMRCFFRSLLWCIVSLSSWGWNDETRLCLRDIWDKAEMSALSQCNGNAFTLTTWPT